MSPEYLEDPEAWMYDRLVGFRDTVPEFVEKPLLNPNNRWLVKSAYQKAIRRGDTELALNMAAHLFADDPEAAFRSTATVIVEDIGPTIPGLLACSTVVTLKTVTKNFDPPRLFAGLTVAASEAKMKTRGCCELALGAECETALEAKTVQLAALSDDELLHQYRSKDVNNAMDMMTQTYWASVVLRQRSRHGNVDLLNRVLGEIMAEFANHPQMIDHMHSFERNVDRMNLASVPVHRLMRKGWFAHEIEDDIGPEPVPIRAGLPSYAYDTHTLPGKRAIRALYNQLVDKYDALKRIDPEKGGAALGATVFVIEGGNINNRFRTGIMDQLKSYQDMWFMISRGVHPEDVQEVEEIVRQEWELFTKLRLWAAGV